MIAIPVSAMGLQMFRDRASLEKNAAWITSRPSGLNAVIAASSIDSQGHRVRTFNVAPKQLGLHYTIIMTGFSISILKAPISSAPSAPSIAR